MMATQSWTYRDGKVYSGDQVIADQVPRIPGRLMAAAPELLAALKALLAFWDEERAKENLPSCCCLGVIPCQVCEARAAIAKAEGR